MLHSSTTPMLSVWRGGGVRGTGWMDGRKEREVKFVGSQEQNIRDHLVNQWKSVTWGSMETFAHVGLIMSKYFILTE